MNHIEVAGNVRRGADVLNPMMAVEQIEVKVRSVGGRECMTAMGRDVHAFLLIGGDYTSWMKVNLARARLKENRDYEVFMAPNENPGGGRPRSEYILTLEAAKHICMLSETERGFEAREYFIDCERRANEADQLPTPKRPAGSLEALLMQNEMLTQVLRGAIESREEQARQKLALQQQAEVQQRQAEEIQEVRSELADIRQYQQNVAAIIATPVPTKPGGCEAMTTLKSKFYKRHGLTGWVVDRVLTQLEGFRVTPKAYVQNGVRHEADGHTVVVDSRGNTIDAPGYLVYQAATCTSVINEFLRECVRVTPCKVQHPAIPGKAFNLKTGHAKGEKK